MTEVTAVKSLIYATRHLKPGDDFATKTDRDASILVALGKAKIRRVPGKIAPAPAGLVEKVSASKVPAGNLVALRAEYAELVGKKPFHGWDAAELRRRIGEARAA